jgi:methyl-accepting chemotaxis protein
MFHFLDHLNIRNKIWAMILLFIGALLAGSAFDAMTLRKGLEAEKRLKTKQLVESAYGVLSHFHELQQAGSLGEEAAQAQAIATIKALRYGNGDYFWLNDLGRPYPKMIMHPTVPSLDGKVLDAAKFDCATSLAPEGREPTVTDGKKNLFAAFVDVVEQGGEGYVTYDWPKPAAGGGVTPELYPKVSFVKKFAPWGWLIGSGIYVDDVDATVRARITYNLVAVAAIGAVLLLAPAGRQHLAFAVVGGRCPRGHR